MLLNVILKTLPLGNVARVKTQTLCPFHFISTVNLSGVRNYFDFIKEFRILIILLGKNLIY
jgi:hypothetical protein